MAEELQREEYQKEEARTERRRQRRDAAAAEQNASWSDWLMGTSPTNNSNSASAPTPARSTGGARGAQPSNSMFSCVAQSITSVMGPQESQVRGVDSTSLL